MLDTLNKLWQVTFLDISLGRFAACFGVILLALIGKRVIDYVFTKVFFPYAARTENRFDDLLLEATRKPSGLLVVLVGLFIGIQILQLPTAPLDLRHFATAVLKVLVTFDVAWFLFNMVTLLDVYLTRWVNRTESTLDDQLVPFIRKSLRVFIVFMAVLQVIQNLGYSISGLLASLGIGGLAVALAAREALSNIFGSVMILLDRPFAIGDWIKAGDMEGTVEEIGFRSTKIRTFGKTLISVPNNIIANMALDNFSRMPKRRIKLTVGVTYETTAEELRQAVSEIRTMLESHPAIDQEFLLVNFTDFGASSLDILVYCFTKTTVWADYLATRQDVGLKIMEILAGMGLEIAFPSRTVYLKGKENDGLPAPSGAGH